ncbi:hypothetical protein Tco_0015519 [Tanacetum coccineum]
MDDEEDDEVIKELYDDVNVNLGNDDTEMTDADQGASEQQNSVHAEEPSHTVEDLGMQQDQEFVTRDNDEQPADKEVTKADCDSSFDFSAFVMNQLKILNLTQEILVRPAFNLLKGTCKSITELEYHLEECSKATNHRGRQIIPKDYFINKDLEYLKGRDLSRRYSTSVTKSKTANYELKWIKDLVLELRIVIQKRVEDLQLGVESYQQKLNLTKPDTYRSNLRNKTAYTSHSDPYGIIYVDQFKRKRLMRTDELHKFSDGTLNDVRTALHDIARGIRMEYPPMRKWSNLDKKRARVMVQDIDKQLYHRRLMRKLVMYSFPRSSQNQRDLPRDILLDSVVVLRYEKRSKSENKGRVPTEMELVLEQTQQGSSYEVSVSAEGVEELKRKVKIKGEKKEALLTLRHKPSQYICCRESQR